ncbi:acylphosphatase [Marinobacter sp. X15-166B]|uniref:acylphosphatase n=1 Tax=Marinobacter sp. X15-166B TaxID=1897620 RepID=UPI00085C2735|nr:acylphosphatase [Marinobacter sp. X15-166B]OEY66246.1 acylphosphatase [Marinobacter sp. X15-166B]
MTVQRWKLIVTGRVQGVYYRASAVAQANDLGLHGYARNLPDGCVEIIAEGTEEQLDKLAAWCREGPPAARVHSVNVDKQDATGEFSEFGILR